MPTDSSILTNLLLVMAAALAGRSLAALLRLPAILGYLAAGLVIGPYTPGPQADAEQLRFLAQAGIALLLFVAGAEATPAQFRRVGRVVMLGGIIQVGVTLAAGFGVARAVGFSLRDAAFLGGGIALSSTAIVARLLQERHEESTVHGHIAFGVCIVQDVAFVPIIVLLLAGAASATGAVSLVLGLGLSVGLLLGTYLVGRVVWPRVLQRIAAAGSAELLLLATLILALGAAAATEALGLSLAAGAFLAGLVTANSPYCARAIDSIAPLRDVFIAIFFVSVGMLLDPGFVWRNPGLVAATVLAVTLGKGLIVAVIVRAFRYRRSTALWTGLMLAQASELSFVLVQAGRQEGLVSETAASAAVAMAVLSMLLSVGASSAVAPLLAGVGRRRRVAERV